MLGKVYIARADLADTRGHRQDAVELARTALRLTYVHPHPRAIAALHHNLTNYLFRAPTGNLAEQRAHRLAATLLSYLTGDTYELTRTLRALATELRRDMDYPDSPGPPTTLAEITRLVDAGDGIRFADLLTALCPNPDTAEQALAYLLSTAATLPDQPAEDTVDVEGYLVQWEPVIAAVTATISGHPSTDLADALDEFGARTDWAALVAALRRVLAGERDRAQLLAGLDDVDTTILTAALDRIATHPGQDP